MQNTSGQCIWIYRLHSGGHFLSVITHWGRVTHICVGKLTIIGSDNGLSPGRRQAIIWTKDGLLLIGPLGRNFIEMLIEIQRLSLKKIRLKMSSAKCCPVCLGLNVFKCEIVQIVSFIGIEGVCGLPCNTNTNHIIGSPETLFVE